MVDFDSLFIVVLSVGCDWCEIVIGLDNGVELNRRQAIIQTNVGPVQRRNYAAPEADALICTILYQRVKEEKVSYISQQINVFGIFFILLNLKSGPAFTWKLGCCRLKALCLLLIAFVEVVVVVACTRYSWSQDVSCSLDVLSGVTRATDDPFHVETTRFLVTTVEQHLEADGLCGFAPLPGTLVAVTPLVMHSCRTVLVSDRHGFRGHHCWLTFVTVWYLIKQKDKIYRRLGHMLIG